MAWNTGNKSKQPKPDFISKASPCPLLWPDHWPKTAIEKRQPPKDNVTHYMVARDYIYNELRGLRATNVLISSNIPINQYGEPFLEYAEKRLDTPGVAVYFFVDDKPYVMACDAWEYPKDNLRAIGIAIGHIRATARTVAPYYLDIMLSAFSLDANGQSVQSPENTVAAEPIKPSRTETIIDIEPTPMDIPSPSEEAWQTHEEWWNILGVPAESSLSEVEAAFRMIARRTHPDRGGSANKMRLLNQAVAHARQQLKNKKSFAQ